MKFTAKTAKQISEEILWPKGNYAFEILEATDEIAKSSGNEQIKLKVKVFKDDGASQNIFDYLSSADKMAWKLRSASEACGLLSDYEKEHLEAYQFVGKTGYCEVVIQPEQNGYDAKNSIKKYLTDKVAAAPKTMKEALNGDDVPF